MVQIQDIVNSLPLLAAVLGKRYGVEVRIGGDEASTDGKVIHLPALPQNCDDDLLLIVRGTIDHESAHIRETDFALLQQETLPPVMKYIFNALEDWRVEHKLAKCYPGCRKNFDRLIEHFFAQEKYRPARNPVAAILSAILLYVRAWDVPAVANNRDKTVRVTRQLFPHSWRKIRKLLDEARTDCLTTADALTFAQKIYAQLQQEAASSEKNTSPQQSENIQKNTQTVPISEGDLLSNCSKDIQGKEEIIPKSEEKSTNKAPETEQNNCGTSASTEIQAHRIAKARQELREVLDSQAPELPQQLGEELRKQLKEQLGALTAAQPERNITVSVVKKKQTTPLTREEISQCQAATVALRARMQRFLQAASFTPTVPGRRGRLNGNALYKLASGDPRIFLKPGKHTAPNTAVHILVDSSYSMKNAILLVIQSCYAVASALSAIKGINVAVTAFPGGSTADEATVSPLLRHGEKLHSAMRIEARGCTPLSESLWWVMQQMVVLSETRKIILILTDGRPSNVVQTREALNSAKKYGFEVYGLGYRCRENACVLPPESRMIRELQDVPTAMFELLQEALRRSAA